MDDLPLLFDPQATMRVTKIVQPYRKPTHPAVIPRRFGKGQRLTHFALTLLLDSRVVEYEEVLY